MPQAATQRKRALDASRAALREIDAEIRAANREHQARVDRLTDQREGVEAAITALGGKASAAARTNGRKRSRKGDLTSTQIAGPAAIESVESFMREKGTAFQSEITEATGLNSGTASHAIRALATEAEQPRLRATGNERRGSKEYAYIGDAESAAARGGTRERERVTA